MGPDEGGSKLPRARTQVNSTFQEFFAPKSTRTFAICSASTFIECLTTELGPDFVPD